MAKCNGCGEELHYVPNPEKSGKWRALNADNSQHYCGGPKKETPTESGEVTFSQREWMHIREQLVAIQMQYSEIWQELHTIRSLIEAAVLEKKGAININRSVEDASRSVEDQINEIDFDKVFKDHFPT